MCWQDQYQFIYTTLLEAATVGQTCVPSQDFSAFYKMVTSRKPGQDFTKLQSQFQVGPNFVLTITLLHHQPACSSILHGCCRDTLLLLFYLLYCSAQILECVVPFVWKNMLYPSRVQDSTVEPHIPEVLNVGTNKASYYRI